jgi:hypothetical protein
MRASGLLCAGVLCGLFGCNHSAIPAAAPDESSTSGASDDVRIDRARMSDEAQPQFEKIVVVDSDSNASLYAFMTSSGEVAPEAFIRRYHEVTGERDIDQVTCGNPGTSRIALGGAMIAGGIIGDLALFVTTEPQTNSSQMTYVVGSVGLAAIVFGGAALIVAGAHANRQSHELSRADAERFAHRYNRVLLRMVDRSAPSTARQRRDGAADPK